MLTSGFNVPWHGRELEGPLAELFSDSITHLGEEEGDILDYRFENGDSVGEKEEFDCLGTRPRF